MADCAPWETITSSGSSQPCSSHTACIAARTSSEVSPGRSSRISERATPIAASAAFCARRMPSSSNSFLTRRRRDELVVVDGQLDAVRAQVVGDEQRELRRDGRLGDAQRAARRAGRSRPRACTRSRPAAIRSSWPSVAGSMTSTPCADDLGGVQHGDRRRAAAVVLQVQERVADAGGDLVEERRGVLGRSVDQDGDGITSRRASTVGTWRT